LLATTNPSPEYIVKQAREALELVEGAGARSLQKYVKEDPKVIEVKYTETIVP
jgi:hypothetical protein